ENVEIVGDRDQLLRERLDLGEGVLAELNDPGSLFQRAGVGGRLEGVAVEGGQRAGERDAEQSHTEDTADDIPAQTPYTETERRDERAQSGHRHLTQEEVAQVAMRLPLEILGDLLAGRHGLDELLYLVGVDGFQAGDEGDGGFVRAGAHLAERSQDEARLAFGGGQQAQFDLETMPGIEAASEQRDAEDRAGEGQSDKEADERCALHPACHDLLPNACYPALSSALRLMASIVACRLSVSFFLMRFLTIGPMSGTLYS